jgi:hypothetical protein
MNKRLTKEPADKGPDGVAASSGVRATSARLPDADPDLAGPEGPLGGCGGPAGKPHNLAGGPAGPLAACVLCHVHGSVAVLGQRGGPGAASGGHHGGHAANVVLAMQGYLAGRHGRKSRMLGVKQGAKASKTQRVGAEKGLFPNDLAECSSPERVTWPPADGQAGETRGGTGQGQAAPLAAGQRAAQGSARPKGVSTPQAPGRIEPCKGESSVSAPGNAWSNLNKQEIGNGRVRVCT